MPTGKRAAACLAICLLLAAAIGSRGQGARAAQAGFTIRDGRLYDANNNQFVMRGVNHAHTWYPQETDVFPDIKAAGANTVRVVLSSGNRWTRNSAGDVANVIQLCKNNRLICVLEVHDTTGYGEDGAAATLAQAVDYWLSIQSVLTGQEAYVIVNIGNEPYGNNNAAAWVQATKDAIGRLRAAGFAHTIMVDAPNWGQDWSFTMRNNAAGVFAADTQANTIFSIHMYGVFDTAAEIESYLKTFAAARLPIVVGEFGHNHSDGNPDEDAIMAWAETLGVGYLGWSWSGNGGGVEYLDLVANFNPASPTAWGARLINGANGLRATSREASVFASGPTATPPPGSPTPTTGPTLTPTPTSAPPTPTRGSPTPTPPSATPTSGFPTATSAPGACEVRYAIPNQWPNGFLGDVTIRNNGAALAGWTLSWTFANGQQITNLWNGVATQSGASVSVANAAWNGGVASGGTVNFGFQATFGGANAKPTAFRLNGAACAVAP